MTTEYCVLLAFAGVCALIVVGGIYWGLTHEIDGLRERVDRLRHHAKIMEIELQRLIAMHRFFPKENEHPKHHEPERPKPP